MNKNDIIELTAERLGAGMEGICLCNGMPVFVPGLLPGETASVLITKTADRYAYGKLTSAPSQPSAIRRPSDCPAFPQCGGCVCRHMQYEETLKAKRSQIKECMARIGKIQIDVPPVFGMDRPFAFRNKTSLPVGGSPAHPLLGFYAERSHRIIPVRDCLNAMRPAQAISDTFLDWCAGYGIPPRQEENSRGILRHLVIRTNRNGESMVMIVAASSELPHIRELAKSLEPSGVVSLYLNENTKLGNTILSDRFYLQAGKPYLTDRLFDLTFEISPEAFYQVNPVQTETLYKTALDFASLSQHETVLDVYCGIGTISLTAARVCKKIMGIEIVPGAIRNAVRNAELNHISNAEFKAGPAERLLPQLVSKGFRPDVIIVDPPRKGLDKAVIDSVAAAAPSRLVYISCDIATQARDAKLLAERGYRLDRVQAVDMFCWASGIENVALFLPDITVSRQQHP